MESSAIFLCWTAAPVASGRADAPLPPAPACPPAPCRSVVIVRSPATVIGGITYRPFHAQGFAEIAFCAISQSLQVSGFGTRLMNWTKVSGAGGGGGGWEWKGGASSPQAACVAAATPSGRGGDAPVCLAPCVLPLTPPPPTRPPPLPVPSCPYPSCPPSPPCPCPPPQHYARERDACQYFLTYADNNAVGYFAKQSFTKAPTMERERVRVGAGGRALGGRRLCFGGAGLRALLPDIDAQPEA